LAEFIQQLKDYRFSIVTTISCNGSDRGINFGASRGNPIGGFCQTMFLPVIKKLECLDE
jgi:hypothetical protein